MKLFKLFGIIAMLLLLVCTVLIPTGKARATTTAFGISTFRNVSSSTKPQATAAGEMHHNGAYTFLNISGSGTHTHWRRWTVGNGF